LPLFSVNLGQKGAAVSTGQNKGIEQFFKVIDLDEQDGEQQLIMNKI